MDEGSAHRVDPVNKLGLCYPVVDEVLAYRNAGRERAFGGMRNPLVEEATA